MAAIEWIKRSMIAVMPSNSYVSLLEREWPEGDNQTFVIGAPIAFSSGLAVAWTSGNLAGISAVAGQNTTGDLFTKVYLLEPGVCIEANFLGSAAANNTLAAADMGTAFDIASDVNLLGTGRAGWYLQDSTSATMARISELKASIPNPLEDRSIPAIGDVNTRLRAIPLIANLHWYD